MYRSNGYNRTATLHGKSWMVGLLLIISCQAARAEGCWSTDNYVTQHISIGSAQPSANKPAEVQSPFPSGSRILSVVALGTSLMWGDGLKQPDTFRYEVANWITQQTARPVQLTTFAHSAAYLDGPPPDVTVGPNPAPWVGDINWNVPSVDDQITCATGQYQLASADLILLDGCINEVNAYLIVAPWENTSDLRANTRKYCGPVMETILGKIKTSFPNATVVVVGYYPLVSSNSSVFGFKDRRRLRNHLEKSYLRTHPNHMIPQTNLSRAQQDNIMVDNSEVFYQESKQSLKSAVDAINKNNPERFFFAGLPEKPGTATIDPNFAYGAPQTHEWLIPFKFLWWVINPDDKYRYRYPLCEKYVPFGLDALECEMNSGFHPNRAGADAYSQSIEAVIPAATLDQWKKKNGQN